MLITYEEKIEQRTVLKDEESGVMIEIKSLTGKTATQITVFDDSHRICGFDLASGGLQTLIEKLQQHKQIISTKS